MSSRVLQIRKPEPNPPRSPRQLLQEKGLNRIGLRCEETLKGHLDRRAKTRGLTLSKHMLDCAIRDLERQRKSGRTLFDAASEVIQAAQLARTGVESVDQKLWIMVRVVRFQAAILEVA